jgi:phosphatidylserine/phosphatidylglycerophosphate/cardiolipin synthase-like enzyme
LSGSLLSRLDKSAGDAIDRTVAAHHRRRLARIGRLDALDASGGGWAAGDPSPRAGNEFELLVDGANALPRIVEAIRTAESSVELAGWHFDAAFELEERGVTLRELLADAAERADVRVLAWGGSPLPLFRPARRDVRDDLERLTRGTRIRTAADTKERPMHCHHEKLVIVDGRVAFVGGIDLTRLAGDRFDRSDHPPRGENGWHDAAARVRGPVVADVAAHFRLRWREVTGEDLGEPSEQEPAGDVELQVVRTVPEHVYDALPRGDFRILESYVRALRSAERLVYLESQFLWSPELVSILAAKLREPPSDAFRVVVLLPARPNNGADDTRGQLGILIDNDRHDRFLACTLYQPGDRNPVYVHAKIGIVDDRWLSIGSANLNSHSFYNDTEACVITCDEELVRETRLALWREHLQVDDPSDETWAARADDVSYDRLRRLPHLSRRTRSFLGPLNGLIVDG